MQTCSGSTYKEALFLYIPFSLSNPYWHHIGTSSCFRRQCVSYSMFTHRVLPLPPQLYVAAASIPQSNSQDNPLQNGNMSSHVLRNSTETMINARKASLRSSSPSRNHFLTTSERNSSPHHQNSALVLRSASGSRRKRTSSQGSVEEIQRSDRAIRPISPTSTLTEIDGSPSQVCLCQPDPKVPRPRNGRLPLFIKHNS